MNFGTRLTERVRATGSPTCVGLDPHIDKLPPVLVRETERAALAVAASEFCRGVIEVTADLVPCVKPQIAFFEALGSHGVAALEEVVAAARDAGMLVILDAKRNDIGSTAEAYARATLDDDGPLGADAVTLSPYLGPESLEPFARRAESGKGMFVLVRTSNPGAGVWQRHVAPEVADWIAARNAESGAPFGPWGAVVGATVGDESAALRERMPRTWFLVPGYGAQGAGSDDVRRHADAEGLGALVVSARGVLYPSGGQDGTDWKSQVRARAQAFVEDIGTAIPVVR